MLCFAVVESYHDFLLFLFRNLNCVLHRKLLGEEEEAVS